MKNGLFYQTKTMNSFLSTIGINLNLIFPQMNFVLSDDEKQRRPNSLITLLVNNFKVSVNNLYFKTFTLYL